MKRKSGQPIKVLVVDDSRTQRELLVHMLRRAEGFEVIGTAANGREAVDETLRLRPNVVAMDIHLPLLDGYEATRQIMQRCPTPIVLVSSSLGDSPRRSMEALAAGALAVMAKPLTPGHEREQSALLTTLRLMADVPVITRHAPRPLFVAPQAKTAAQPLLLAIAASTGGPAALQRLLSGLGDSFPLPVVIAQHISRGFAGALAEWLDSTVPSPVGIALPDDRLVPGRVYLAPDDQHLVLRVRGFSSLQAAAPEDRYCPSGDLLFQSVARVYGPHAIGVVLTGMGDDGAHGLSDLYRAGAITFAQDQASSVVYGMPRAAAEAGAVTHVESIETMADAVRRVVNGG